MDNSINQINNLNFKARLNVNKVRGSKQRWNNIAKIFEEKTPMYPDLNIDLSGSFTKGLNMKFTPSEMFTVDIDINKVNSKKLLAANDNKIARMFIDFLDRCNKSLAYVLSGNTKN